MTICYRVIDWSSHFETAETRKLKRLYWVPLPCKQDGDGYTELLDHPNGAAHFGAWTALIQVAAKSEPRGTLLRHPGIPHDSSSLSRITRIPSCVYSEAIPRLLKMRWLEALELSPGTPGDSPGIPGNRPENLPIADTDLTCPDLNGPDLTSPEGKGTEQQPTVVAVPPAQGKGPTGAYVVAPCALALAVAYFGNLVAAQTHMAESVAAVGEDIALAWLMVAEDDRRGKKIKSNPLQYYRGLMGKGEPPDKYLAAAKKQLRPHAPNSPVNGQAMAVGKVL